MPSVLANIAARYYRHVIAIDYPLTVILQKPSQRNILFPTPGLVHQRGANKTARMSASVRNIAKNRS